MDSTLAYFNRNEKFGIENNEKINEFQIFYDSYQKIFLYRCKNEVTIKGLENIAELKF
jgi:hypothetical protein